MTTTTENAAQGGVGTFEPMLKVPDVARILATGRGSIYAAIDRGELHAVRVGHLLRVPESALREFVAQGGRKVAGQ